MGAAGGHGAMSAGAATVRRLGPGDLAAVRAMLAMMGTAFGEEATFTEAPPGDAYLERLLARNGVVALAAFDGPDVVGGLVAYVLEKFEQERSEVYLYDLAVAETHRRRGIATALIGALRRIAAEAGAWVVFVQADYGDDPAVALYTKLGTREDVMHFDIAVPPRRP